MADFYLAIPIVLQHEGKVSNLRGDPGGLTQYGFSSALCAKLGCPLPQSEAEAIALYKEIFWHPLYNRIISQTVGTKILDDCVNQGDPTGIRNLQNALCAVGSIVVVDGIFGQATLNATNLVPELLLLPWMRKLQYGTYDRWIEQNPVREDLRRGLANRAAWPDDEQESIAQALLARTYQPIGEKTNGKTSSI